MCPVRSPHWSILSDSSLEPMRTFYLKLRVPKEGFVNLEELPKITDFSILIVEKTSFIAKIIFFGLAQSGKVI